VHRHGLRLLGVLAAAVQALGITAPVACAPDMGFIARLFSAECDWPISMLGWIYTLFFVFLGCSAAVWAAGWNTPARARPAWCRHCAGAAAC
jgi:hypothetical protein